MEYLNTFIVPVIVGLCLVAGYLIKHTTGADNRFIPLVVTVLGASLAVWMNWPHITPECFWAARYPGSRPQACTRCLSSGSTESEGK